MRYRARTAKEYLQWFLQAVMIFFIVVTFVYALKKFAHPDLTLSTLGISAFAATTFLVFVAHDTHMAHERRIFFGYIFAIAIGAFVNYVINEVMHCNGVICTANNVLVFGAALTALSCFFMMTVFSCEHPPAIGLAIGFSIGKWHLSTIIVIMLSIIVLLLVKRIFGKRLTNLL